MSDNELFGLMVVAREQQATTAKAAEKLEAAREALLAASAGVVQCREAAVQAFAGAVATESGRLGELLSAGFRKPTEQLRTAAEELERATRRVSWWVIGATLLVGIGLGFGMAWWWMKDDVAMARQASERAEKIAYSLWLQTPEGKKAVSSEKAH